VINIPDNIYTQIIAYCIQGLPDEACGLLGGIDNRVTTFYPAGNTAKSARLYVLDPKDYLRADRDVEARGIEILGVVHSHTHTEPYPSPTDIEQAPDPSWHYVIVGLGRSLPTLRSYSISAGTVVEETVQVSSGTISDIID
jgi:proteasome lid subunit RPN8/RPN11